MIIPKPYQQKVVGELVDDISNLLSNGNGRVCVFQSPTGSGKTLMAAWVIEGVIKSCTENSVGFLWVSIGKGSLHLQSKRHLTKAFGGFPTVSLLENKTGDGEINSNEVVVVNWEKLRSKDATTGDWKNILMRDGETKNLFDILDKTRRKGRKIVLIIDESHVGATSERTRELKDIIDPDVVLEMSATPVLKDDASYLRVVNPKDVIGEEMIKKEIIINENIDRVFTDNDDETDTIHAVLKAAVTKREYLKMEFEDEGVSYINPLVLVQIHSGKRGDVDKKIVTNFLANNGITESNGKLAIWLSEQKSETLDTMFGLDNPVEFLIFKQAIDTGWDCPRAQILVKLRESKSETFEIQTVGRILRMPEQKHYRNESLNKSYVFTNVLDIKIKKEIYNPNIITLSVGRRRKFYKELKLRSFYKSRVDYGDITTEYFEPIFNEVFCQELGLDQSKNYELSEASKIIHKRGILITPADSKQEILVNGRIESKNFDETPEVSGAKTAELKEAPKDVEAKFLLLLQEACVAGGFKNISRATERVQLIAYRWFYKYVVTTGTKPDVIHSIFLHPTNKTTFEGLLAKAFVEYKETKKDEVAAKEKFGEIWCNNWEIPPYQTVHPQDDEEVECKKSIYDRLFLRKQRPSTEKSFEEYLEATKPVKWWWKNGKGSKDYFGIRYEYSESDDEDENGGKVKVFYPDYLVQFKDGRLGILEIKDPLDPIFEKTKRTSEALQGYLKKQKRKDLFGGIVIEVNKGQWQINSKTEYTLKHREDNWEDWEDLDL